MIGQSPITWCSRKQRTIALSSMEAAYMALCHGTHEAIWLQSLLAELGYAQGTIEINADSQAVMNLANNPVMHGWSKHIDIQYHFTCEKIVSNEITVNPCASENNLADIFTKALAKLQHDHLTNGLGIAVRVEGEC